MNSTRRRFIVVSACGLAAATLARVGHAAPARPRPTLGFNLYGMKRLPLPEAFAACARIGYRNVEVCMRPGYPAEPARLSKPVRVELRRRLEDLGLAVSAIMPVLVLNGDEAAHASTLETLRQAAELGHDLSPEVPPLVRTGIGDGRPAQWEELKSRMVARLGEWADTLRGAGAVGAIGGHVGNAVNSSARLLWLHQQVARPQIELYFDHVNYALEGEPFERSIPALVPHCRFAHLQDASGTPEKKNYLIAGEGPTDYVRYFREMGRVGFSGALVAHVSGKFSAAPGYDPVAVAEKCFTYLDSAMRHAGV